MHVDGEGGAHLTRGSAATADLVLTTDLATLWDLYGGTRSIEELERSGAAHASGSAAARDHLVRVLAPPPGRTHPPVRPH